MGHVSSLRPRSPWKQRPSLATYCTRLHVQRDLDVGCPEVVIFRNQIVMPKRMRDGRGEQAQLTVTSWFSICVATAGVWSVGLNLERCIYYRIVSEFDIGIGVGEPVS